MGNIYIFVEKSLRGAAGCLKIYRNLEKCEIWAEENPGSRILILRKRGTRFQYKMIEIDSDIKKTLHLSGQNTKNISLVYGLISHLFRIVFVIRLDSKGGSARETGRRKSRIWHSPGGAPVEPRLAT